MRDGEEDRPLLSVVVVNYNGGGVIEECVESYRRATRELACEILVVDNRSTDGSRERIAALPGVRLIESPDNLGYAGGANLGLAASRGRVLIVSNFDVRVRDGALERLVGRLEERPEVGLVGPALYDEAGVRLDRRVGTFPTLASVVARRCLENLGVDRLYRDRPRYLRWFGEGRAADYAGAVDQVSGAFLCARRAALLEVGPMDDGFFLFLEETDWCRRMWGAGWEVHLEPEARVDHLGSVATAHLPDRARIYDRSMVRYLAKHRGATEAILFDLLNRVLIGFLSWPRRLYLGVTRERR